MSQKLKVEIWSDIACPWCYVGKRRLEAALEKLPANSVEVEWKSFELDASAPKERDPSMSFPTMLSKKYGMPITQAEQMIARTVDTARGDGLDLRFDRVRGGNTFDAHRVVHLGKKHGKQAAVKERMMKAYMTDGERIGDFDTLARLGAEAGLDEKEVREMLASDAFTKEVRADEAEAREIGVNGVPFFVIDHKYAVSGAQPAEVLVAAITRATQEHATASATESG
jgi:predicted DsbA family dithiol-disulfide isomerase